MNDFNALLEDFADTLPKLNKWVVLVIRILAILILVFGVVYFFTDYNRLLD
jgi:flagellar biosynthesis/type III secretory pathway M-ring protein FliF/YscJ